MANAATSLPITSVVVIGTLFLSACTNPPGTFFKAFSLRDDVSYSTDARQRVITSTEPKDSSRPGLVDPKRIICAEPSPDVAIAVANSFAVGASVLGQGSGSVSAAQAEGLAQLAERTVTVQLLRDQMYRACEAYGNGAITGTTYSLIMSKNNKAMVTLMLGETAGGAFGRSLAAIGLEASAEAQAATQGLADNSAAMKKASDDLQAAEKDVAEAKEKLDDKEKIQKDATPAEKEKADQDVEEAKTELANAEAKRDAAAQRLNQSSEASSKAAAKVAELTAGGGIQHKPTAETAAVLADMQRQFLQTDFSDEYVSACLVELGLAPVFDENSLRFMGSIISRAKNIQLDDDAVLLKYLRFKGVDPEQSPAIDPNIDAEALHERAEQRQKTYLSLIKQNRRSELAVHCADNLFKFVTLANKSNATLRKFKLDVELQGARARVIDARTRGLLAFNKAADTCKSVSPEKTAACLNAIFALAGLGSDDAAPDFAPAVPTVTPPVD
jgi:Skp family chaperone for outer membrane proteins